MLYPTPQLCLEVSVPYHYLVREDPTYSSVELLVQLSVLCSGIEHSPGYLVTVLNSVWSI